MLADTGSRRSSSRPAGASKRSGGSSRSRKPTRRADPLWARLLVVFGALLMMASGGTIVGGKLLIGRYTAGVPQQDLLGVAGGGGTIDGAINMLLVGLDERPNQNPTEHVRSDTIVILHIPKSHDQAFLVSIPRDARVSIPPYPKTGFAGEATKINAAFAYGHQGPGTQQEKRARGVELLALTLRQLAGIKFTGAAIIDFQGFEKILHVLGGVYMCVERRAQSIHLAYDSNGILRRVWYDDVRGVVRDIPPGGHVVVHEPGCRHMSPQLALDYSRIRKGLPNGDYDRQRHQQQLLKAIVKEAMSKGTLTDPAKLDRVMKAAGQAFTLDTQSIPIEDFIFTLKGVAANEMVLVKTNAGKVNTLPGTSDELLSPESMEMLAAVRDERLFQFLSTHPHFLAPS